MSCLLFICLMLAVFKMTLMRPCSRFRWAAAAVTAAMCLAMSATAGTQAASHSDKLDDVVQEAVRAGRSVRAIVRFTDDAARERGAEAILQRGGRIGRTLRDIGALNAVLDPTTAEALASDAGVAHISVDAEVRSSGANGRGAAANARGNGRSVEASTAGRGLSVAVIDSGVQPHTDLPASRIRTFVDFVNGRSEPYDDFGHGTHVAGIVAGSGAASASLESPYAGIAPLADVVALKVLDGTGAGRTSDVIAALEWVAAHHHLYNIRVVNLSLGHPVFEPAATDPLVQAAESLVRRGIVVVASAGNMGLDPRDGQVGSGGITSPANGPSIIAVGAVDTKGTASRADDSVTDYSSRGPTRFDLLVKPDLVAPGQHVVSLSAPGSYLFDHYPALHVTGGSEATASYLTLSGTSMAAPSVAGVAALMVNANPRLSAGTVRAVLEFTAEQLPGTNAMTQGAGYLNVMGAVRLSALLKPRVAVGEVWLRSHNGLPLSYDVIATEQVAWGKHVIWGDAVLMGDSAYLHLAAWDDNIVWGQGRNIVWGQDNIVWGQCDSDGCDNIVWGQGDNIVWGQATLDNIVWGQDNIVWGQDGMVQGSWADNTVWGFWSDSVNWTTVDRAGASNIEWGQDLLNNIVCGQDNIVWGQDNIVWGQNLAILTKGAP